MNVNWKHVSAWIAATAPSLIALWHLESPTTFDLVAKYVATTTAVGGPTVLLVLKSILAVDPGVRNADQGSSDKTAS